MRLISVSRADLLQYTALSRANGSARAKLSSIDELAVLTIGLRMVAAANMVEVAALVGEQPHTPRVLGQHPLGVGPGGEAAASFHF